MKKKKITEPLNLIQHQLLWNGKLIRTREHFFLSSNIKWNENERMFVSSNKK